MARPLNPLVLPPDAEMSPEFAFAQVLRARRQKLGLSQADLTGEEEFDQAYISKLELGQRQVCIRGLFHLAGKLRMEPEELIAEVNKLLREDRRKHPVRTR